MPSGNAPTVRQRRIGSAFRKARDRHNLTVATVARRGRSQGWMSMVENGLQFISADELNDLLDFYAIEDGPLRESLLHLATHTLGTWARAYEYRISAALDLASLEEDSAEIRSFEPSIVPGLLQIPEYARKIIAIGNAKHPHDVRTLVDFRMSRQRALSQPSPPRFVALIAEAVLHNQVGRDPAICERRFDGWQKAPVSTTWNSASCPARPASTSDSPPHRFFFLYVHLDDSPCPWATT
ncbi:helix-turn-helix transcriptional regulator [Actinomadura madurae]|nr:helix-turn-helix transcriptional regulator [Actinomadura madurae]MCP9949360.1 helix-turn-helix transcriptional regulator [Actinomadura madurae]MCP9966116.1 helix-turn-helix transcriptional regulator [Actinomadura madurae]MCQ0014801.1 helix-turn-helix transcriptional regulator [Actinomadura madurae]